MDLEQIDLDKLTVDELDALLDDMSRFADVAWKEHKKKAAKVRAVRDAKAALEEAAKTVEKLDDKQKQALHQVLQAQALKDASKVHTIGEVNS